MEKLSKNFENKLSFKRLKDILLNLFFPANCPSCGKYGGIYSRETLCEGCRNLIKPVNLKGCSFCGKPMVSGDAFCKWCARRNSHIDYFYTVFYYESVVRDIIRKFKYGNREYLGSVLSEYLIDFFNCAFSGKFENAVIIPIPLHKDKLKVRGFNQSEIIASYLSKATGIKMESKALIRIKNTKPQFVKKRCQRFDNLKGAFMCCKKLSCSKDIILVDDVATTGATMQEAAKTLKSVVSSNIIALALAHGRFKRGKV